MLALAENRPGRPYWAMAQAPKPKELSSDERLGAAIRHFRRQRHWTQQLAADELGVALLTWQRYERGERTLGLDKLTGIAAALGIDRQELLDEAGVLSGAGAMEMVSLGPAATGLDRTTPTLPVRDRVQAGAWLLADDLGQTEARREYAIRDPRYAHADQWLSEVVGDSVDLLRIYDGDMIQCVDLISSGYQVKTGDIVEVERARFGGQERELTVKQAEVTVDGTVFLWPRSTNPRWREPLALLPDQAELEIEVRIRALVVRVVRRLA
jgi:transcriptional regulator with XRE-family HTH domain